MFRSRPHLVICPDPRHRDAGIQSRGTRKTEAGIWSRYQCQRPTGATHFFRIQKASDGSARVSVTKPPVCPEHSKSNVVRHGTYGAGATKRQRYRCNPIENLPTHTFSPPLSREAVGLMASCSGCDELLSPHRGTLTAARHTPWTLAGIIQALNNLSLGLSYAAASIDLRAQRKKAFEHLSIEHGIELLPKNLSDQPTSTSLLREQGRNSWHLGADLVEQYSPILFSKVIETINARESKVRAANDAFLEEHPDATLANPIVYLLDEAPIYFKQWKTERTRHQQNSWSLLVVVELLWSAPKDPSQLPKREARLRLVRAYPRGNEDAWVLVLNELPVRPDFIIADAGLAIRNAIDRHYGVGVVGFVPSLYHIQRNIRNVLEKLPHTTTKFNGQVELTNPLNDAMKFITRADLVEKTGDELSDWWDGLISQVRSMGAPTSGIKELRKFNEPRLSNTIAILNKYPHLPASNAAVEARIRLNLEPFLENRKHRYRNLARTNFLLDLAVARSQGLFTDLNKLSKIIRESNEAASGWAPSPRKITDRQPVNASPATPAFASLLNAQLIPMLSKARGITPAIVKPVRSFPNRTINPGIGSGRPKGSKNKPKAEKK